MLHFADMVILCQRLFWKITCYPCYNYKSETPQSNYIWVDTEDLTALLCVADEIFKMNTLVFLWFM